MFAKKLIVLFLAAGFGFGALPQAQAAEVKVSGVWDFNFEWNNVGFKREDSEDRFKPRQRLRTQIDIIASESLKGVVQLQIGDTNWGNSEEGASIGTDGKTVGVRYSYIDWKVPNTELQVRMGLQPFSLPGLVAGSAVLGDDKADGAGMIVSYAFSDQAAATAFWLRAANNNWETKSNALDFVGLTLPVSGEGWQVIPWGMFGMMGKNSLWTDEDGKPTALESNLLSGLLPLGGDALVSSHDSSKSWWLGVTGEVTLLDNLRLAGDFVYGRADWGRVGSMDLTRKGWLAAGLAEYKFEGVTPGLLFWYASGDDSNAANGSERLPTVLPSWQASSFGYDAAYGIADGAALGLTPTGTWGVTLRFADISFLENLSHTLLFGYYRGTNSTSMPRNAGLASTSQHFTEAGGDTLGSVYMTTKDQAWEVNFDSQYAIYENFTVALELGYIHLDLNEGVWGDVVNSSRKNAWKTGVNLQYTF